MLHSRKSERKVYYSDVAEVEKAIVVKYGITVQEAASAAADESSDVGQGQDEEAVVCCG